MVSKDQLLVYGIAPSCLSEAAASKMDDRLAAKLFSARYLLVIGTRLQYAIDSVRTLYMGMGAVKGPHDFETDVELIAALDAAAGAYWGLLPWVFVSDGARVAVC